MSVVITGYGVVSAIGSGRAALREGLRSGACGVQPITRFDASAYKSQMAAEVHDDLRGAPWRGLAEATGVPLLYRYGRAALYSLAACAEALEQAGLGVDDLSDFETGLAFGGSTAGMAEAEGGLLDEAPDRDYWAHTEPATFLGTPVGSTAAVLARALQPGGPVTTVSTACSSATNALGLGLRWLRRGECRRVIVGGSDAHCRLTHAGFCSLGVVAPERPLPFDGRRKGMVIGEGAAFFVLERAEDAAARGAAVQGRILGFGNGAEAFHPTQPRPDGTGAEAAMAAALRDAGVGAERVDYVNAPGTATPANDVAEAAGVHRVFGARGATIPVSSSKSQLGHILGASGAVELAAVLEAMHGGFLPPTAGWAVKDEAIELDTVPESRPGAIGVALSNSFAFGGNDASLCVAHPDAEGPWTR